MKAVIIFHQSTAINPMRRAEMGGGRKGGSGWDRSWRALVSLAEITPFP